MFDRHEVKSNSAYGRWSMNVIQLFRKPFLYVVATALFLAVGKASAQDQNQDEEVQMGQEVFNELKAKGEIIESSPLYDQLKPIADAITRSAQPRYNHRFNRQEHAGRQPLSRGRWAITHGVAR